MVTDLRYAHGMTRPDPCARYIASGLMLGALSAALSLIGGMTHSFETVLFGTILMIPAALVTMIGVYRLATAIDYLVRASATKRAEANTTA
jgi:hypothetical protein